jgi:arylsulfatase
VIVAQGGMFGGWSIYLKDGCPTYGYNLYGLEQIKIRGTKPVPAGVQQVRMEFAYDGGGLGKGAAITLYVDGEKTGEGRIERSTPMLFSLDDYTCAISDFNGKIKWIQIDLGEDATHQQHLITPEERYRIAMAVQ